MRLHEYSPGAGGAATHPSVAPELTLVEVLGIEEGDAAYRVGEPAEIDVRLTAGELFGAEHGHVIVHPCKSITINVGYSGRNASITVHPSERVKKVIKDAAAALGLDDATAKDLAIRVAGTTQDLVVTNPIGAYVGRGTCSVTLDLVHIVRPQG